MHSTHVKQPWNPIGRMYIAYWGGQLQLRPELTHPNPSMNAHHNPHFSKNPTVILGFDSFQLQSPVVLPLHVPGSWRRNPLATTFCLRPPLSPPNAPFNPSHPPAARVPDGLLTLPASCITYRTTHNIISPHTQLVALTLHLHTISTPLHFFFTITLHSQISIKHHHIITNPHIQSTHVSTYGTHRSP